MKEEPQKIRFTKRDIKDLGQYPSSGADHDEPVVPNKKSARRKRKSFSRRCLNALISVCLTFVILCCISFLLLRSGINSDMLRNEAQYRLQEILGPQSGVTISEAQISLDRNRHLALEARDVVLTKSIKDISVEKLGVVKLGLAPLPLLSGSVQVAQVEISDAVLRLKDVQSGSAPLFKLPFNERGLVDFKLLSHTVFNVIDQTLVLLDLRNTQAIALHDVTVAFQAGGEEYEILIRIAEVTQSDNKITLKAQFIWQGQSSNLTAEITRSADRISVSDFSLTLDDMPVSLGSPEVVMPLIADDRPNPAYFYVRSLASLKLTGKAATNDVKETLSAQILLNDAVVDMGRERGVKGNIALDFEHVAGTEKLEITTFAFNLGGLRTVFEGAFGAEPETDTANVSLRGSELPATKQDISAIETKAAYRFELLSRNAESAAQNSGEQLLNFGVKIAGRLMQNASRVDFNELSVKTDTGELYGQGRLIFGHGSPAMIFLLRVPAMAVSQAKQLWPLNVANGARDWVFKNLFGGTLTDSRIDIALPAGHFNGPGLPPDLTPSDVNIDFNVEGTRFDVIGDIPPVRDAAGLIAVRGAHTTITLKQGAAFTNDNRRIDVQGGTLIVPWGRQRPVMADLDLDLGGEAAAITELVGYKPINVLSKLPFTAEDISGNVTAKVKVAFAITKNAPKNSLSWNADLNFDDIALKKPLEGQVVSQAKGTMSVNKDTVKIIASARLNNIPAKLTLIEPLSGSQVKPQQSVRLELDDKIRASYYPALNPIIKGPLILDLDDVVNGSRKITADLAKTSVSLPWLGWKKGAGIPAKLTLELKAPKDGKGVVNINNLVFSGTGFNISGNLTLENNQLQSANISKLNLTRNDKLSMEVRKSGNGYRADVQGSSFDARALIQEVFSVDEADRNARKVSTAGMPRIVVNAHIDEVKGFYDESLRDVTVSYETAGAKVSGVSLNAKAANNARVSATSSNQKDASSIALNAADAGAVLRFFDFYDKMRGGKIVVNMTSQGDGPLYGNIDATNFSIIDEPRLAKVVSSGSNGGKSLNQAVRKNIDVSRADFERAFAQVEKGEGYLRLKNGILRGPLIGATFQGGLYDRNGNMEITGTFMPAYGLNRLFAELPLLGVLLGNGRDRGLIGITYKLTGNAKQPTIIINPISVIAPGIFRTIFEF